MCDIKKYILSLLDKNHLNIHVPMQNILTSPTIVSPNCNIKSYKHIL